MILVRNIKLKPGYTKAQLWDAASERLGGSALKDVRVVRLAIDARHKDNILCIINAAVAMENERAYLSVSKDKDILPYEQKQYKFPYTMCRSKKRPVVAGSGPAGVFCALLLAEAGLKPILIERGSEVDKRRRDVAAFFAGGQLNTESNVQFGEGGAGTFSDGKLTTGTRDPRQSYVLKTYADAGAPDDILYMAKPHMGTDRLVGIAKKLRQRLIDLGGDVSFDTRLTDIDTSDGGVTSVEVVRNGEKYTIDTDRLVLATGHSARDIFELLYRLGAMMKPKPFAAGVRIEHIQRHIDLSQYGSAADFKNLPPSDYKLACHMDGRAAYTFCVCPGGEVVAAASEEDRAVTNGMSSYSRGGENCNGALLVNVTPADLKSADPLAGINFQRRLESRAFILGGSNYHAPAQLVGDFLSGRPSKGPGGVFPTYRPGVTWTDLSLCLPGFINKALKTAIAEFGRKIKGFDADDAVLTAVETRSSSPITVYRDDDYESNIKGLHPCGEGAGAAGGIMSSAVDGIKCAEAICEIIL